MLVRAFEVEIGGPSELRPLLEHKGVSRARIEPYLDDVGDLLPLGGIVGIAEELRRIGAEPDIGSGALDRRGNALDDGRVAQRLTGLAMGEHRDRHAPGALARDAPFRLALDHRLDPVTPLRRDPSRLGDRSQRLLPHTVGLHADEPLRRVAKDQRRLRSPGMRIGMHERPAGHKPAGGSDRGEHRLVGIPRLAVRSIDRPAGEEWHLGQIDAIRSNRVRGR